MARPILLFDVMETLVTEPFRVEIPAFFNTSPDELKQALDQRSWIEFEEGGIDHEEFISRLFVDRRAVDAEAFCNCVRGAYRWIEGMETILRNLKHAGYEIHAFSNYPTWYIWIDDALGLSRYLQWTFVSCRTGLCKPDPKAYLHVANSLGVNCGDCLFIDDRRVNVEAARSIDMEAIHYINAKQLQIEFSQRSLPSG